MLEKYREEVLLIYADASRLIDDFGYNFIRISWVYSSFGSNFVKTIIKNEKVEIYNYSNEGVLSWYDFAKEIMRMAKLTCKINPIETKEYPTPAQRPHYSLLNKAKIKKEFGIIVPYWKDGLDACLKKMDERR